MIRILSLALVIVLLGLGSPALAGDRDGDGVDDAVDNCPDVPNPAQTDLNGDGLGDECMIATVLGATTGSAAPLSPGRYDLSISAQKSITMKVVGGFDVGINGSACAPKMSLECPQMYDVIATAARGSAIRFAPLEKCEGPAIAFNATAAITGGGGIVKAPDTSHVPTLDTTGTNPRVAVCAAALAAAGPASARFAALNPVRTYGAITVASGDEFDIDGTGGGTIDVESITLVGGGDHVPSFVGGALVIDGNGGNDVVVNVRKALSMGRFSYVAANSHVVMNFPGRGPAISILTDSGVDTPLLAPDRTVRVYGDMLGDDTTTAAAIWAKTVRIGGLLFVGF